MFDEERIRAIVREEIAAWENETGQSLLEYAQFDMRQFTLTKGAGTVELRPRTGDNNGEQ